MEPLERERAIHAAKKRLLELLDDESLRFEEPNALTRARRRLAELIEAHTLDRELRPKLYRELFAKRPGG